MKNNWHIDLEFHSLGIEPQLTRLRFQSPFNSIPILAVRSSRVRRGEKPFRWTPGTISVTLLFLQAKLNARTGHMVAPALQGTMRSPAAALVNAILRYRMWLFDLFGVDSAGRSVLSSILVIQNQRLRAAGPVRVYLREGLFNGDNIRISLNDSPLDSLEGLTQLKAHLSRSFESSPQTEDSVTASHQSFRTHDESVLCAL
jgi:hypothetical protein